MKTRFALLPILMRPRPAPATTPPRVEARSLARAEVSLLNVPRQRVAQQQKKPIARSSQLTSQPGVTRDKRWLTWVSLFQTLWRRRGDRSPRAAQQAMEVAPTAVFVDVTGRRERRWNAVGMLLAVSLIALLAALVAALLLPTEPPASMYPVSS